MQPFEEVGELGVRESRGPTVNEMEKLKFELGFLDVVVLLS